MTTQRSREAKHLATSGLDLTPAVYEEIRRTVGVLPAEHGGMLGSDRADGTITHYYFDHTAQRSGAQYSPDCDAVNRLLKEDWNPAGIRLRGFVHSHPAGVRRPSHGDLVYAERLLEVNNELERFAMPIAMTTPDTGNFELLLYSVTLQHDHVQLHDHGLFVSPQEAAPVPVDTSATYVRVRSAYDLARLARCRVIAVGTGGAASFLEDLARAGIGEFVLLDRDVVTESNLATQQVYRKDVGRPKVECIAERIRDINPNAIVETHQAWLDDLDDGEIQRLVLSPLTHGEPQVSLLCGLTDNFYAQARINRLALQLGVPSLCAQVYHEGRGAEITFTFPGVTPACQRCALSKRYDAYLSEGFVNDVTSDGTPIFATTRLNALKGFIAMALLHHGTSHPRWGGLLERIGKRNLVQIRMDPDLHETLGLSTFDRVLAGADQARVLFDDVVWLPQDPDRSELNKRPTCPDCGGTGDLRSAKGTFVDTRVMHSDDAEPPQDTSEHESPLSIFQGGRGSTWTED